MPVQSIHYLIEECSFGITAMPSCWKRQGWVLMFSNQMGSSDIQVMLKTLWVQFALIMDLVHTDGLCTSGLSEDLAKTDEIAKSVLEEMVSSSHPSINLQLIDNIGGLNKQEKMTLLLVAKHEFSMLTMLGGVKLHWQ